MQTRPYNPIIAIKLSFSKRETEPIIVIKLHTLLIKG